MIGLIVLAGGKSSRMGRNKALLPLGNKTGVERILEQLSPISSDPILVTNDPHLFERLPARVIPDNYPGKGPVAGLEAGLSASEREWNLLVACDMPFVSLDLAKALLARKDGYDCVVPMFQGRVHPLFALYNKNILEIVQKNAREDRLKMMSVLEQCQVLYVKEQDLQQVDDLEDALFNMNNPTDYETAVEKWRGY